MCGCLGSGDVLAGWPLSWGRRMWRFSGFDSFILRRFTPGEALRLPLILLLVLLPRLICPLPQAAVSAPLAGPVPAPDLCASSSPPAMRPRTGFHVHCKRDDHGNGLGTNRPCEHGDQPQLLRARRPRSCRHQSLRPAQRVSRKYDAVATTTAPIETSLMATATVGTRTNRGTVLHTAPIMTIVMTTNRTASGRPSWGPRWAASARK